MAETLRSDALAGVPHGFLSRAVDPSEASAAAAMVLPGAPVVRARQVHSADALTVAEPWPDESRPQADALATDRPGILLGVVTADCAPVLLADKSAGVIGAAHAGWRGAKSGVIEACAAAMERLGARRGAIAATIGPCIAQASYEVDESFHAHFAGDAQRFFAPGRPDHWQFDLEGYVAARLAEAGVERVERLGLDTYADPSRFYSYRRATHRGEPAYGRQLSLIGMALQG